MFRVLPAYSIQESCTYLCKLVIQHQVFLEECVLALAVCQPYPHENHEESGYGYDVVDKILLCPLLTIESYSEIVASGIDLRLLTQSIDGIE